MSLVVLDTDVASASLRDRLPDRLRVRLAGDVIAITFVTLGELTKWAALRDWGPRRYERWNEWRAGVLVLPFDEAVATTWGELQARAHRRGRPRPINDTWIASCCLVDGLPLATFNVKDYADFVAHDGLKLIDAGHGPMRPQQRT